MIYLGLEVRVISKKSDDRPLHTVNDLGESHEGHFLITLYAIFLMITTDDIQLVNFFVIDISLAGELQKTAEGTMIVGLA